MDTSLPDRGVRVQETMKSISENPGAMFSKDASKDRPEREEGVAAECFNNQIASDQSLVMRSNEQHSREGTVIGPTSVPSVLNNTPDQRTCGNVDQAATLSHRKRKQGPEVSDAEDACVKSRIKLASGKVLDLHFSSSSISRQATETLKGAKWNWDNKVGQFMGHESVQHFQRLTEKTPITLSGVREQKEAWESAKKHIVFYCEVLFYQFEVAEHLLERAE